MKNYGADRAPNRSGCGNPGWKSWRIDGNVRRYVGTFPTEGKARQAARKAFMENRGDSPAAIFLRLPVIRNEP